MRARTTNNSNTPAPVVKPSAKTGEQFTLNGSTKDCNPIFLMAHPLHVEIRGPLPQDGLLVRLNLDKAANFYTVEEQPRANYKILLVENRNAKILDSKIFSTKKNDHPEVFLSCIGAK